MERVITTKTGVNCDNSAGEVITIVGVLVAERNGITNDPSVAFTDDLPILVAANCLAIVRELPYSNNGTKDNDAEKMN